MRRVAVRGVGLHEGKLLCVCLRPYNEMASSGGEWWCLPGGTVDEGEALEKALVREMQEEIGVIPHVGKLLYVHQFMFRGEDQLEFFFHIVNPADFLSVDLKNTTHGPKEIKKIDFVDPKTTIILPKFLSSESLAQHIETESPVKFFSFVEESND